MALEPGVNHDLEHLDALYAAGDEVGLQLQNGRSLRSIAISLKRIADALEPNHVTEGGALNVRDLLSELVEQGRG